MDEQLNKSLGMLKDALNEEIKKVTKKNDITPVELENMTKTLCLIEKIKMIEEGGEYWGNEEGHSHGMMPDYRDGWSYEEGHSHGMMPDYRDGWSYGYSGRRMRSPSTGRYTSGTSYGPGYSGHSIRDRMVAKLEEMYDEAKTEHERQIVDEWINRLRDEK